MPDAPSFEPWTIKAEPARWQVMGFPRRQRHVSGTCHLCGFRHVSLSLSLSESEAVAAVARTMADHHQQEHLDPSDTVGYPDNANPHGRSSMTPTTAAQVVASLDSDAIYPRDDAHRYRLYALDKCGECGGRPGVRPIPGGGVRAGCIACRNRGTVPVVRACALTPGGVGLALVTVAEERREAGLGPEIMGVLDAVEGKWLTTLWKGRS
jgi:hypothetical protein